MSQKVVSMQKVGIKFNELSSLEEAKEVAQHLQRFVVEGDYRLETILKQLNDKAMILLDVSNEENMPELTTVLETFDEEEIGYELYKKEDEVWQRCSIDDLDLDRHPILSMIIGTVLLGYFLISFVEIFAIYDWFTVKYELGGFLATLLATITAYVPVVGSIFAYFGATELWHWSSGWTLFFYFWYYLPVVGFILYLLWMVVWLLYLKERWYGFWNPWFRS